MKALRLDAVNDLRLVDMEKPRPGRGEILVRTRAALICTSDINDLRSNPFNLALPVIMGHEGAGIVEAVGDGVEVFSEGQRVAAHPVHPCGNCANCLTGLGHLCLEMGHFGINMQGVFAEYFVVRQDRARVVGADVPFEEAALAEPVAVCLEALSRARLGEGDSLLVMGDGPFGVIMARLAAGMGLSKVVVAGHHDSRLKKASPAVTVNTKTTPDALEALAAAVPQGYGAAILAVGSADAARDALSLLRARGRCVVFSAIPGGTTIDLSDLHIRELEILGACNDEDMFDTAVEVVSAGKTGLSEVVTHRFSLSQHPEAFSVAEKGHEEALKVAFVFDEAAQ